MKFFFVYCYLLLLLVRSTLSWHVGARLVLRSGAYPVRKLSTRTNGGLELRPSAMSRHGFLSARASTPVHQDTYGILLQPSHPSEPNPDAAALPAVTVVRKKQSALVESSTLKGTLYSVLATLGGGWSTVMKSLQTAKTYTNKSFVANSTIQNGGLTMGSKHITFSKSILLSSVLLIKGTKGSVICHSTTFLNIVGATRDRICNSIASGIRKILDGKETRLNQVISSGKLNVKRTGETFRTLRTALKELSIEAGNEIRSYLRRYGRNNTMHVPLKDPYAENQFSRVRASSACGNSPDQASLNASYSISTLSAFVGKWYRQGRLLLGAKAQKPTENLSDAVLAYLAAADSLGIDFKHLSAVASEQSIQPVRTSWLNLVPKRWRAELNFSSQPDSSKAPSREDLTFVHTRRTEMAIAAALAVHSAASAQDFVKHVSLQPLLAALQPRSGVAWEYKEDAMRGLTTLVRFHPPLAVAVASMPEVVAVLCDMLEAPYKGFPLLFWSSRKDTARKEKEQRIAVELVLRMVRSSELAGDILRQKQRLRKVLLAVGQFNSATTRSAESSQWARDAVRELEQSPCSPKTPVTVRPRRASNKTVGDGHAHWEIPQMARIAAWGLGGVPWRPRQPGQKGLRILSLDGGGTRGVLSIAILREIMQRVYKDKDSSCEPHQMFDIICGTSTGGIIATLLGTQRASLFDTETLYDAFIEKIFGSRSNMRLVTSHAAYDERDWEKILHDMCGDALMLDSNQHDCPRVFCVSARANTHPPTPTLWRNYNYPPGQVPRYPGACRVNTFTAIRSTTAAPTFFTPVHFEDGLYFDGALVANNPTAIAMQEAKLLYPNVPVELVVSIGTGLTSSSPPSSSARSMGWDVLVNQLIASSTDTEDVHALLHNFLSPDKYFRFNPVLPDVFKIDEKNKTVLTGLKNLARKTIVEAERGADAKVFAQLVKTLRGPG